MMDTGFYTTPLDALVAEPYEQFQHRCDGINCIDLVADNGTTVYWGTIDNKYDAYVFCADGKWMGVVMDGYDTIAYVIPKSGGYGSRNKPGCAWMDLCERMIWLIPRLGRMEELQDNEQEE